MSNVMFVAGKYSSSTVQLRWLSGIAWPRSVLKLGGSKRPKSFTLTMLAEGLGADMHFGPHEVLLNLDLRFRDGLSVSEINEAIDRIERTSAADIQT